MSAICDSSTSPGDVELACTYDGEPNGLAFHKDGRGIIADHYHGLMRLDPEAGTVEPYLVRNTNERFRGTNDLTFASNGKPIYRINSCAGLLITNCAYGGSDGKTLYITESSSGKVLTAEMPTAGRILFSHM